MAMSVKRPEGGTTGRSSPSSRGRQPRPAWTWMRSPARGSARRGDTGDLTEGVAYQGCGGLQGGQGLGAAETREAQRLGLEQGEGPASLVPAAQPRAVGEIPGPAQQEIGGGVDVHQQSSGITGAGTTRPVPVPVPPPEPVPAPASPAGRPGSPAVTTETPSRSGS